MIEGLKPYPVYKDSGIPWADSLPSTWRVERGKWLFRKMSRPVESGDEVVTCFRDGTVTLRKNRRLEGFTESLKEIGYQRVHRGDLVIHAMDAFAGAIGVSDSDGKCTPVYSICEPIGDANPFYYAHIVREMARTNWILALATGIRERSTDFRFDSFAAQFVPLPPADEQSAIVRFLGYADRQIRRYIGAKRQLITLLKEQKQAIITHAATRGLDPSVRLRYSGVDWLGDIPEHWDVRRLRNVASMLVSNVDKHTIEGEVPVRLCNYVDVYKHERITDALSFMRASATREELVRFRLELNDVLITKDSETWKDIGVPSLVEHTAADLVCGYHLALLRPHQGILSGPYLLRALQSVGVARQLHVEANGVTRFGLSHAAIKSVSLPHPPTTEQTAIVQYLDEATSSIARAISDSQSEILLLNEYRIRLISEIVTGKLDVSDALSQLNNLVGERDDIATSLLSDDPQVHDEVNLDAVSEEIES